MFEVEIYGRVRRAVFVEGRSQRAVAREFGLSRETIRKMLQYAVPPGYQRQQPINRPKLGPWVGAIDAILNDDKRRPTKQRHTAKRIFDRLREEQGFTGGYTIVKDYVRTATLSGQEMFVPLVHPAGEAQVDFGEALVVIAGVEQKAHYLVMDLPHSDDCFVIAFPAETTEAFLEGHVRAFEYFGGVPTRILYDNTKIAVAKILGGEERQRTRAFSELQSYYLFADKFGRPAKGNDKGKVEGLVGYARRNFMVPVPRVSSWQELNAYLEQQCRKRRERRLRGHTETIGERFERDRAALLPLPAAPYEACEKISARVSSLSLVRYRGNDYSVPTQYGHRQVWVKGYVHEVAIACASEVIVRHQRSYEREAVVFDPLHYLALLEQKTRALDQAAPLAGWQLPECFAQLRRLLEARLKKHGSREYIQVLRLMETFALSEVTDAIEDALKLGTIGFDAGVPSDRSSSLGWDAVRHLLLCHIERRPPQLDMENYPHLPLAQVSTTQAADYMTLLVEACA
jgi:transposase